MNVAASPCLLPGTLVLRVYTMLIFKIKCPVTSAGSMELYVSVFLRLLAFQGSISPKK